MKSFDKLSEAMNILNKNTEIESAERCKALIRQFLIDNTPEPKGQLSCKMFVSHDEVRAQMCCVFHDNENQVAVATDAHALYVNESEYRYTEGNGLRNVYGDEPTKDEIVCDTPITDLRNYPKWQGVIPTPEKRIAVEIRNDLEQVYKEALADAKLLKVKKPEDNVIIRVDGTSWFCARMVKYMLTAGTEGWVRRRWNEVVGTTVDDDDDNYNYRLIPNGGNKPFLKEWDGQKLLLMPMAIPSEEEMKEYGWTDSNKYDAEKGVLIRGINN